MNGRGGETAGKPAAGRRRGVLFILAVLGAATGLRAAPAPTGLERTVTQGNVKATFAIPGDYVPRFGFVPVRVTVDNRETRDLRWELRFAQTSYSNSGGSVTSRSVQAITVPAGRQSEHRIHVPVGESGPGRGANYQGWSTFSVQMSGGGIRDAEVTFNPGGRPGNQMAPWAVAHALEGTVRARLTALTRETTQMRGGRPVPGPPRPLLNGPPNLSGFDPAEAAGDWRTWAPFARVILPADDYAALAPANRAALRHWVALGGTLYLVPAAPGAGGTERHGVGTVIRLRQPIAPDGAHDSEGLFDAGTPFRRTPVIASELAMTKGGMEAKVPRARRAGDWLVYFFVGFAVLIGPVNLFALAAGRRRHRLFLTIPAISLAAVAVLGGAIFLQDGTGGEGVRRTLVVLLPGDHHAAVFQEQVARTGLLFGTGFPLADDTVCAAVPIDESAGRPLELVRRDGAAAGDWFRGRARQGHHLRRIVPTRARVELVGAAPDGAPIVQSTLGAALRDFRMTDRSGVLWTAERVPAGVRTTLRPGPAPRGRIAAPPGDFGQATGSNDFDKELVGPFWRGDAEPFRYLALADESELAPIATHPGIQWSDTAVLVTGLAEGAAGAGKGAP